ncbi:DUF2634 domain-containing protein [Lachnoanaerobaculum orale]|uniref:DUF2634 domain-containing protein n=1 Tax=Lachnoanaerobaculum orale TaxID=979627 RepID=A0A3P3Q2P5_9FIRM|nr:DUF2634 domain-containing protein [Lachnoanaerobaculum orale]RRJ15511.1 DUF2634 domain-containing protein [Lachnoanaerobaculum orale]
MSILPSFLEELSNIDIAESEGNKVIEVPREYGIDFTTGQLTGKIVEGLEAIKVWVWLCMHTERFRHAIYSSDYGTSLEQYFGHVLSDEYINTDCESEITDALLMNDYIESVEDFEVVRDSDSLNIKFRVLTKFGSLEVDESVRR